MKTKSAAVLIIEDANAGAEALTGFIRICVALILGATTAALAATAETIPTHERSALNLAIAVVSVYLAIGLISVLVVRTGRYRSWMAWVFGLADVTLVCGNLYLSPLLDDASTRVALSTPAAFLMCLLFVTQMFRYRVGLQTVLSLLLVGGVTAIIFTGPATTDADVDFLVAGFQDIPNAARLVLIALVGLLSAFAVWRGRQLLIDVAEQTERSRNATRFLPAELRDHMGDAALAELHDGRSIDLVVMFVDVRGFTAMSEALGPQDTSTFLTEFRSRIIDVVTARDGVIDKFIGDGALIVFGLQTNLQSAATDAIAVGSDLLDAIEIWNAGRGRHDYSPVRIVVAAHAGPAIAGTIGDQRRLEFSVVGSVVNEASRVESYAKQHDLAFVVSAPVLAAAGQDDPAWVDLGETPLRGRSAPVRLYRRKHVSRSVEQGPFRPS